MNLKRLSSPLNALTAGLGLQVLSNAVQGVLLARWLGLDDFGIYALGTAAGTLAFATGESRTWEACVVYWQTCGSPGDPRALPLRRTLTLRLAAVDAVSGIVVALAALVAWAGWRGDLGLAVAVGLLGAAVRLGGGATQGALRASGRYRDLAAIEAGLAAGSTVVAVVLAAKGASPVALVAVMSGTFLVRTLVLAYWAGRVLDGWTPRSPEAPRLRDLRGFLVSGYLAASIKSAVQAGDVIVAGAAGGVATAALLRAAKAPTSLVGMAQNPALQVHAEYVHETVAPEATVASRRVIARRGFFGALLASAAAWPLEKVLGPDFRGVTIPVILLAIGSALWGFENADQLELMAAGRHRLAVGSLLLGAMVTLGVVAAGAVVDARLAAIGLLIGAGSRVAYRKVRRER